MIIYPLPPQELDDATLSRQIKNIAQYLINAHVLILDGQFELTKDNFICNKINSLQMGYKPSKYNDWVIECRANYLKLVEMGINCCVEYNMRFNDYKEWMKWKCEDEDTPHCTNHHKLEHVIFWARDNVPDLPQKLTSFVKHEWDGKLPSPKPIYQDTLFPLVMPKKYLTYGPEKLIGGPRVTAMNIEIVNVMQSYRNHYRAKLKKDAKFTRREKPEWIDDL